MNARVFTGDARRPWADAVLVHDGRVEAVGSSADIRKRAGSSALVIDAKRQMLVRATERSLTGDAFSPDEPLGKLVVGGAADLLLLDRDVSAGSAEPRGEARVVLRMAGGHITLDRDGLTR